MLFSGWAFFRGSSVSGPAQFVRQVMAHPSELYWHLRLVEVAESIPDRPLHTRRLALKSLVKIIAADPLLIAERGLPDRLVARWRWREAQDVLDALPPSFPRRELVEASFLLGVADRCTNRRASLVAARAAIDRATCPEGRADSWASLVGGILVRQDSFAFQRRFSELLTALQTGPFIGHTLASWLVEGELSEAAARDVRLALATVPPQNRDSAMDARLLEKDGLAALARGDRAALHRIFESLVQLAGSDRFFPTKLAKKLLRGRLELELCALYFERIADRNLFPVSAKSLRRFAAKARAQV